MNEVWRNCADSNRYFVSNLGRVRGPSGRILKQASNGRYWMAWVEGRNQYIHHLVATAFIGPRPEGMLCCHLDDDRDNNNAANLYWGTPKQNTADIIRNGNWAHQTGTSNGQAKLTPEQVREIRASELSGAALGRQLGVSHQLISLIRRRKLWAELV
jgi:hypothetical protein